MERGILFRQAKNRIKKYNEGNLSFKNITKHNALVQNLKNLKAEINGLKASDFGELNLRKI